MTLHSNIDENGRHIRESMKKIEGKTIWTDLSGVGHNWALREIPANIEQEIAAEIIDGKLPECSGYTASNGVRYRWS